MKKYLLLAFSFILFTSNQFAQSPPESFKYQAIVRDTAGNIVANQLVSFEFHIRQGSLSGTSVFQEQFSATTNSYGLVNLDIGTGTLISGDMATIDWSDGPYFIETGFDITGGTTFSIMSNNQLMSVPYALYAKTSGDGPGPAGPPGADGANGSDGATGPPGADGATGPPGADGATGPPGADGAAGPPGADGATGPPGADGATGPPGADGATGPPGADGATGPPGADGATGPPGADGATGPPGADGATGPPGADGATGPPGADGATGPPGADGATGPPGADGATGPPGADGATGPPGADGATGPPGADGATGPPGADGATGPPGADGATGPPGADGATGPPGADGATGPPGADGATGPPGADGATGPPGADGATGPPGADGATGPPGADGATGPPGADGATGPPGADGATGPPGADGATGPPGADGATGPPGADGADGILPDGTATGNTTYWDGSTWVVNSSNIFNNGGNVGIGDVTPTEGKLVVKGTDDKALYVSNMSANTGAYVESFTGTALITTTAGGNSIEASTIGSGIGIDVSTINGNAIKASTLTGAGGEFISQTGRAGLFNLTDAGTAILSAQDNGTEVFTVDDGGYIGIGDPTPENKLDIEFGPALTTGDAIVTRSHLLHGSGTGTANGTALQGYAETNSWTGTVNLVGIHGLSEDIATTGTHLANMMGVKGEAIGTTLGTTNAYGGYFTATGADNNYALFTDAGGVRLTDLAGTGDRMVIANSNGDLSTQAIPVNTDAQTLSLAGTLLSISGGNSQDLSSLQDGTGTDNQNISGSNLSGTLLTIGIESGGSQTVDLSTLSSTSQWSRDATNGEVYPSTIADEVGIGTTNPLQMLHVVGTSRFARAGGGGSNYLDVSADGSGVYITSDDPGTNQKPLIISANPSPTVTKPIQFKTDNTTRVTITGDGDLGVGTTTPSEKLSVNGNASVDNGYLNVGGTATSTTRTGIFEFDSDDLNSNGIPGWQVNDNTETSASFGTILFPPGVMSISIYKVEYDVQAYHEDNSEQHWLQLNIGGSDYASTRVDGFSSAGGSGFIAVYFNEVKESVSISPFNGASVKIKAYDEGCCLSDYFEIQSVRVRLHYTYTIGAQDGDIVAGGRLYANSTKSVGDVAEYFPVAEKVEIGHIIASEPGKSNSYKLADVSHCNHLIGVISKEPSVVLNDPSEGPPVGLTGRVIVKLVDSERLIVSGDFITSSNQKGLGQLATKEGPVIGYAVRNQNIDDDFVEILLQPGRFYKPKKYNTLKGDEMKANSSDEYEKLDQRIKELEQLLHQQANKDQRP